MADKMKGWFTTVRSRWGERAGGSSGEVSAVVAAGMLLGVVLIVVGAMLLRAGR